MLLCVEYVLRYYNHYHGAVSDRVLEQKPNAKATAASLCKEPGKPIGWKRNRISELD